jgi:glutathione S-transferase
VLNDALAGQDCLAGNSFTVADLNVASIFVWGKMARLNLSNHPEVARWFDACLARPAYGRVRERARSK